MYPIYNWTTPVSIIPEQSVGNFHIVKRVTRKGTTIMMNALGHERAILLADATFTILLEGEKNNVDVKSVWMSDPPVEYFKAWELVVRSKGEKVLVGGLGLGLIVHLLAKRRDIEEIWVVEKSWEVIKMVKPFLPKEPIIKIIHGDFLEEARNYCDVEFSTIIADIWKSTDEGSRRLMEESLMVMQDWHENAVHLVWHFQEELESKISKYLMNLNLES